MVMNGQKPEVPAGSTTLTSRGQQGAEGSPNTDGQAHDAPGHHLFANREIIKRKPEK